MKNGLLDRQEKGRLFSRIDALVNKLAKNYTQNAEAYQAYLKGRFYSAKSTEMASNRPPATG